VSLTAAVVATVFGIGLVLGLLRDPIFALLSYLWIYYNHPPANWWGSDLPDLRYSLIAALVALVSTIGARTPYSVPWYGNPGAKLVVAYCVWMWCQLPWAVNFDAHVEGSILATKYVILFYLIYKIITDEKRFETFFWAHVLGCFILGWTAYRSTVHGRLESIAIPGVDDANLLAAQLITGAAIAGFMFVGISGHRRWILFLMLPFMLNAFILTQSRGGMLALAASAPVAWYLAPKKHRGFVSVAIVLGAVLFLILTHEQFWERASTIFDRPEGAPRDTRLEILMPQINMFLDHPLGAGHRGNEFLSPAYIPAEHLSSSGLRSAHSTFIAALVDQGFPGAILLVSLYFWVGLSLLRLKRLDARGLPPLLGIYRAALGTALVGCFFSGLFVNLLKTEVQIWLLTLLASLMVLSKKSIESLRASERVNAQAKGDAESGQGPLHGEAGGRLEHDWPNAR
jgi:hypothetical protein